MLGIGEVRIRVIIPCFGDIQKSRSSTSFRYIVGGEKK